MRSLSPDSAERLVHPDLIADRPDDEEVAARSAEGVRGLRWRWLRRVKDRGGNVGQHETAICSSRGTHLALAHRNDVPGVAHAHVPLDASVRQTLTGTPGMSMG